MLRIESVSKRFRSGNYGVRDASLNVKGGVLGLLGPNGAGKTTLMQMIATVTKPTANPRRRVPLHHVGGRQTIVSVGEGRMSLQRLAGIVRADFLIRLRRPSTAIVFLLLSAVPYLWIPDPATGRPLMQIAGKRALYNSATIGMPGARQQQRTGVALAVQRISCDSTKEP